MQDLKEIRKMIGVCPQHNVQFDALTVKENLTLFANIKGIVPQSVAQEVGCELPVCPLPVINHVQSPPQNPLGRSSTSHG